VNGKRSGQGNYLYANGDVYEGAWQDDLKNGPGFPHLIS
jgi:radial spoke head protein 1